MLNFPYGIADFRRIRRDAMVYVDRTSYIRDLEMLGSTLVFLRPRRFGKSLWIQTMATYYDLRYAERFDEIFGGLAIHQNPTPLQGRFFVLQWNFSLISPRGGVQEIATQLREHVQAQAQAFASDYAEHLPAPIQTDGSAQSILISLLAAVRQTPYKLYLLIDEYDNFVNEIMVKDVSTYQALFEADGPFKELMKAVKNATEGLGLERVFVTGVSPVALNDLTSGFNTATDVSRKKSLAGLCGFHEEDLRDILAEIAAEHQLSSETVEELVEVMRIWYNGYRFHERASHLVYNPTNVLYCLRELYQERELPQTLHDANLRTDQAKLAFLARTDAGTGVIEELSEGTGEVKIRKLLDTFSLGELTQLRDDRSAIASFLYYMGLLTLTEVPGRLRVPNLVVKKLFLDRLLEVLLPQAAESSAAREVAVDFFESGDLTPLLTFFEEKLLPILSNRDLGAAPKPGRAGGGVNETFFKGLFLSLLFDDQRFVLHSEMEIDKGYVDLFLQVRPENRYPNAFDILIEFKFVRRPELGKKGAELRTMDEAELRKLGPVEKALADARTQVRRYRDAVESKYGAREYGARKDGARKDGTGEDGEDAPRRSYVVVAVGLERILGEEV